jgi:hypothetical protein
MRHLPEPVRHPSVVRAAVSPTAVAVTAAGAGIGLGLEHSIVLAVVLGAGAWMGRMAVAVAARARRAKAARPKPADVDPWSVPEPWRQLVRQAVAAQNRFDETVAEWSPGPTRDRLFSLQPRLYAEVREVGSLAHRGAILTGWTPGGIATAGLPSAKQLSQQLGQIEVERRTVGRQSPQRDASLARTEEAVAAQLRALRGAEDAAALVHDRLRVLVAQLDQAVTALMVIGVEPAGEAGADALAGSLDTILDQITALQQGLADTSGGALDVGPQAALPSPPPSQPPPASPTP